MIKYENNCVDCAVPLYPCIGDMCPYVNVPHFYCDTCGDEVGALYDFENKQQCIDCIEKCLKKVEIDHNDW